MPLSSRAAWSLLLVSVADVVGCAFEAAIPADTELFCNTNADCPADRRCDLVRERCLPPGVGDAPRIVAVAFDPPAVRNGPVRLVVRADRGLDPEFVPALTFAGDVLRFSLVRTDGDEQTLVTDINDDTAAGLYLLTSVRVRTGDGAEATSLVASTPLLVDRTPPTISAALVTSTPPDGVYADRPGLDLVEVQVQPAEPLRVDLARLLVGSAESLRCQEGERGLLTCSARITSSVAEGAVVPHVLLQDLAGNETDVVLAPIRVDTTAPTVVADSVVLTIVEGAAPAPSLGPAGVLRIDLVASEELQSAPVLSLDVDGALVPLALANQSGRRFSFLRLGSGELAPGTYNVAVSWEDRFGHGSTSAVVLPAPFFSGIPVGGASGGCPAPAGVACVDIDGDEVFGFSATCPEGLDFADLDVLSHPFAIELPGDGIDNDGAGGDLPIDEDAGVFVDSEAGDDANDATRGGPVRTMARANQLLGARTFLFLAARQTPYDNRAATDFNWVLGGLDATTWTRTETRSVVEGSLFGPLVVDSVVSSDDVNLQSPGLIIRSILRIATGGITIVRSRVGALSVSSGLSSVRVFESILGPVVVTRGSLSLIRTQVSGNMLLDNGQFTLVGSAVSGSIVANFANLRIFGSTIIGSSTELFAVRAGASRSTITNSIVSGSVASLQDGSINSQVSPFNLVGNDLVPPVNCELLPRCSQQDSLSVDPDFSSLFHLAPTSPLRGAVSDPLAGGAPTSVLADIDGNCRLADGSADIGADDVP